MAWIVSPYDFMSANWNHRSYLYTIFLKTEETKMTTTYEYASYHSIERAKERIGYNTRNAEKQIERAMSRGKTADQFTSWERDYLQGECGESTIAIAYNNFCYIVSDTGGLARRSISMEKRKLEI